MLRDGLHLLVGRDIRELVRIEAIIRRGLGWGLTLSVALGLLGGLLMSRRINGRLELINRTSREIMAGDLGRRIPERGTGDEFDELSGQLARHARAHRGADAGQCVRHVADNVAHDLRTPLTRLRARLEMLRATAWRRPRRPGGGRHHRRGRPAAPDLQRAAAHRLDLEAGGQPARLDAVPLDQPRKPDAADMYQAVAEVQELTLPLTTAPVTVPLDRDLLFQALVNPFIDNAISSTPPRAAGSRCR